MMVSIGDGCTLQGQYGNQANECLTLFQKHARRTSDCIVNGNTLMLDIYNCEKLLM